MVNTSQPSLLQQRWPLGSRQTELSNSKFVKNDNESYFRFHQLLDEQNDLALYYHFPFCQNFCSFCALNIAVTHDKGIQLEYVNALIAETKKTYPIKGKKISALYLGGGTPSSLHHLYLEQFLTFLFDHFDIKKEHFSFIIECHPNDLTPENLKIFKKFYATELRLGIQDLDPVILKNVNRFNKIENIEVMREKTQDLNLRLGADFIVGLPLQTTTSIEKMLFQSQFYSFDFIQLYPLKQNSQTQQNLALFGNSSLPLHNNEFQENSRRENKTVRTTRDPFA